VLPFAGRLAAWSPNGIFALKHSGSNAVGPWRQQLPRANYAVSPGTDDAF